jgi:hypothetical protein
MSRILVSLPEPGGRVSLSFEERSVWVQLISLLLVLGGYFVVAGQMISAGVTQLVVFAPVFTVAVVLMVVVIVAGHIVAALTSRPEEQDERDRLIGWRAESQSSWLVATGVITGITAMVFSVPAVWVAHLLLFSLFLSEIVKLALRLVYYRRGI